MNRALFLDRDGVINEDYGYVHKIEDFHFREGIFDVCRAAQKASMKIIVVTNQAGIGRGLYDSSDFNLLTQHMNSVFWLEGVLISGVYFCPFHPAAGLGQYRKLSYDRKPNPGMIVKACQDHNVNPAHSIMCGDNKTDQEASARSGIRLYVDASQDDWKHRLIGLLD
jgi:D-glycero-D-manno-heptose 1,7-bisphosphate phosphatase